VTEEWTPKAGDDVVVKLHGVSGDYGRFYDFSQIAFAIRFSALKPVPVAMTEAEAALIGIAIETAHGWKVGVEGSNTAMATILKATSAVLAERAPPDPVDVAWKAVGAATAAWVVTPAPQWFRAALKAFVAAGGGKS